MSSGREKKIVGVSGGGPGNPYGLLFGALSRLYPVEFREVEPQRHEALDGLIVLDGRVAVGLAAAARGVPAYVVLEGDRSRAAIASPVVHFGASAELEACLRNREMAARSAGAMCPLPLETGDEVLASRGGHPVWLSRPGARASCQLVAAAPMPLAENEFLFQHLNGGRFLRLLPLANFLRQLVKDIDWQSPGLRACFVFDDPSLYWPSYGYINYRRLAEHARQHDYYVSVATIPIDAWWVNQAVAATFRSNSPRLSLLIHGNNHTSCELLNRKNGTVRLAAAAQALSRMERLEQKHGIAVFKILEAPHAVIAWDLFQHLMTLGYDAALGTTELLVRYNPQNDWPKIFGLEKSAMLGGGLPVIPRIRMSPDWRNEILLAAFLQQPILIAGHHQDASEGLDFLADIAGLVNSLPGVSWSDPQGILRNNYLQRVEGDVLTVKMYSRRLTVAIPEGVKQLVVERPWVGPASTEKIVFLCEGCAQQVEPAGPVSRQIAFGESRTVEVSSEIAQPMHFSSVTQPAPNPWPIARKVLMEVRDRLSPALPFMVRLRRRAKLDSP